MVAIRENNDPSNAIMSNIAQMFQMSQDESIRRGNAVRADISGITTSLEARDRETAIMARDQFAMTSQVTLLTQTASGLRQQLVSTADFAVDAFQQVR